MGTQMTWCQPAQQGGWSHPGNGAHPCTATVWRSRNDEHCYQHIRLDPHGSTDTPSPLCLSVYTVYLCYVPHTSVCNVASQPVQPVQRKCWTTRSAYRLPAEVQHQPVNCAGLYDTKFMTEISPSVPVIDFVKLHLTEVNEQLKSKSSPSDYADSYKARDEP